MAQEVDLSTLIGQARDNFTPPGDEQLAEARDDLNQSMERLERFVRPRTANGQKWLSYLKWEALGEALAAEGELDLAPFVTSYQRLNRNEVGLELAQFRQMSDALRRYIDLTALSRMADPAAVYRQQLDRLAGEFEQLRALREAKRTGGGSDALSREQMQLELDVERRLDFFAGLGQAEELLAAIHRKFAEPNAFLNISGELVRASAEEPIDRTEPVTDNILGARIRGTGHTTGTVTVQMVPSDEHATIELQMSGRTESENVGRKGPAVIRSTSHTDFTAGKRIELSDAEFGGESAHVEAETSTDIHSVRKAGGGIGTNIVARQGMSRALQSQPRAEAIAADHAEDRIRRRIDQEVGEKLREARRNYEDGYRDPLARHGDLPDHIRFRSTSDDVTIEAIQANRAQLGAPAAPPAAPTGQDLVVRLHESAMNNYWSTMLGGATASEMEPGQEGATFDVKLPEWVKEAWQKRDTESNEAGATDEPFKPWTLTFRQLRPLTVEFTDDQVKLTTHLARLSSGDEVFTDWDVTAIFTPQLEDGGAVLLRDGELVVLPTGFDPQRDQLSSRQVGVRSNLTRVLNERSAQGRGFPSRIQFDELEPTGTLEKVGPLALEQFTSDGGWITLAWNRSGE